MACIAIEIGVILVSFLRLFMHPDVVDVFVYVCGNSIVFGGESDQI